MSEFRLVVLRYSHYAHSAILLAPLPRWSHIISVKHRVVQALSLLVVRRALISGYHREIQVNADLAVSETRRIQWIERHSSHV